MCVAAEITCVVANIARFAVKSGNCGENQEGYIEELTRFSQCLNAKTGFVNF